MTRKENLLVEIYNLRNQIAEIKGIKKQNVNVLLETSNINKIEEIAEKLALPLGTVKTQIHRAREQLCRYIVEDKM